MLESLGLTGNLLEKRLSFFQKLSAKDRIDFYGFLESLVKSEFGTQDACAEVAKSLERQADNSIFGKGKLLKTARLYREIEGELRLGNPLHVSLAGRVPDAEIMMLLAGYEGETVDGLKSAKESAQRSSEIKKRIVKSITYPSALAAGVLFALNWIGNNLIVTMEDLMPVEDWTPPQQLMHWITTNVSVWAPLAGLILLAFIGLVMLVNIKFVGPGRESIAVIPPFNVIRRLTATTYLSTLSSLVLAGLSFQNALVLMKRRSTSDYLGFYLDDAVKKMKSGLASEGPGKAIACNLFSPWVMVKLDVYSRGTTEEFTDSMREIADDAQAEALASLDGIARGINLILLIAISLSVAFTVVTMFGIVGEIQSGVNF